MNYSKAIKNNWSALAVTYGSMLFEGAIITMLVALMTPLSQRLDVSLTQISMLITVHSLGTISVIYLAGNISDKIGRKKIILLGLCAYFLFLIGMYFTTNFYFAILMAMFAGFGHGLMDSPSISMLIDIFGNHSGPAMSFVAVFFSGGGVIATLIIREMLKFDINIKYIYLLFLLLGAMLFLLVSKAKYPPKQRVIVEESDNHEVVSDVRAKRLLRAAILLAVITFLFSSGNSIIRTWVATYANTIKGMSLEKSVGMLSYLQIGNVIGAIAFAYILTKVHSTKVLVVNGFITAVAVILFLVLDQGSVLFLLTIGIALSVSFALALNIIGELYIENSGQATGFIGTASMASGMVMTFITGQLLPIIGVSNLIWLSFGAIIIASVLALKFLNVFNDLQNRK